MKVCLTIESGPSAHRKFEFAEAGGFTFGRANDCTCTMPEDDSTFSRHHFILEINPPNVFLKDLGSLNGTYVNGVKHGGRAGDVAPENAAASDPVGLRDGDRIRAGRCELSVTVDAPAICVDCGKEVPGGQRKAAEFVGGSYLCQTCREKEEKKKAQKKAAPVKPAEVELDIAQRKQAESEPGAVIEDILRRLLAAKPEEQPPAIQGYRDMRKIGEGGFGAVYSAIRASDGRKVAIKTMLQTRKPPERQVLQFLREMEIAKQLRHSHIVHCENASQWKDVHFIEMEYMDGGSVWDVMRKGGPLPLPDAMPIMLQTLMGLAHAHTATLTVTTREGTKTVQGVVHRDLKPPNILLAHAGGGWTAKIGDFGLAKAFSEAGMTRGSLTAAVGSFCGTPPYIAPEHLVNYRYVKPPTDVFEIAASFYHMLTGEIVWPIRPGTDPIKAVLEGTIIPIRNHNPAIPRRLGDMFDRALARDERQRYPTAAEMLKDFGNACADVPPPRGWNARLT